jgi:hypothetical protein
MIITLNKYYFYDNVFNYSHYKKNKTKLKRSFTVFIIVNIEASVLLTTIAQLFFFPFFILEKLCTYGFFFFLIHPYILLYKMG